MSMQAARERSLMVGIAGVLGALLAGCNSLDKPAEPAGPHVVIPLDERPAVTSAVRPRSISGGTLTALKDGKTALVADPDRDRISVVDLVNLRVTHTIALEPGDEPGRSIEDDSGHVHVALRGGGSIVSVDPSGGTVLERRAVCKAPRGLAFDAVTAQVHVACAEGKLVSLPAAGGAAVRSITLPADLRDVIVQGNELWVTRFKSAEVLRVDAAGAVAARVALPKSTGALSVTVPEQGNTSATVSVSPGVAWRALANPGGGALLVHQQEVDDDITISEPTTGGSAYGGGGTGMPCDGIVKNAVSTVDANGHVVTSSFVGSPLAVDVAPSPDGQWLAVAHAGPADGAAPRPFVVFPQEGGSSAGAPVPTAGPGFAGSSVSVIPRSTLISDGCAGSDAFVPLEGPATAVAFTPNGQLLVQTEEPAKLALIRTLPFDAPVIIDLQGESRLDTGHQLFHRDAGGGIACASCHPEGGEDGHTWHFVGAGARRTQSLQVGLKDTAPFHWAGDLPDVNAVMTQVFVGRMGGVNQTPERTDVLSAWLFGMQRTPAIRDGSDADAARGKELFESTSVGCSSCHSGEKLTNNQTVAVDSAREKLQVPSLVGVGYRAPFMHDGCAATLAARFDPTCGGDAHGNVAGLSEAQKNDLVAYLESL